ncbi:MAG: hypothetical protein HC888_19695, partial [Candidatus Competibacteraceae bacterium]|nr:hypothetical protein [Candidatus Competibacteraceae bacterium]
MGFILTPQQQSVPLPDKGDFTFALVEHIWPTRPDLLPDTVAGHSAGSLSDPGQDSPQFAVSVYGDLIGGNPRFTWSETSGPFAYLYGSAHYFLDVDISTIRTISYHADSPRLYGIIDTISPVTVNSSYLSQSPSSLLTLDDLTEGSLDVLANWGWSNLLKDDNVIIGSYYADTIDGGEGNDVLLVGRNQRPEYQDILFGGPGNDTFFVVGRSNDLVADLQPGDALRFHVASGRNVSGARFRHEVINGDWVTRVIAFDDNGGVFSSDFLLLGHFEQDDFLYRDDLMVLQGSHFTESSDVVIFNRPPDGSRFHGNPYYALGGNDEVMLPDVAGSGSTPFVIGTPFDAGDGRAQRLLLAHRQLAQHDVLLPLVETEKLDALPRDAAPLRRTAARASGKAPPPAACGTTPTRSADPPPEWPTIAPS